MALEGLLDGASALSQRVACALPRFTLHDATHLKNVLHWMQGFVAEAGLEALGPKGCGLCLLLAYTHDLGMVPEAGWEEKLNNENSTEAVKLRRFTNERHPDLADLLERSLPEEPEARALAERICGHICEFVRTDFLRVTHAEDGDEARVVAHLRSLLENNDLKKAFGWLCAEENALQLVALLIASHNQSIDWLEKRLRRDFKLERPWTWTASGAEKVNLLLPCLLLRLADICDFDASRTPRIVFHQLGLEGGRSLGLDSLDRAIRISRGEWQKHLSVDGWRWSGGDGGELVYSAGDCPHPAVEKAIRRFCGDIAGEFEAVERLLRGMAGYGARAWLRIPGEVKPEVKSRGYEFHDVEFKLQAHEVTELLMGTALYGNPELCIRELLQNALDAVQLRELRHKLKIKLADEGIDAPPEVEACEGWIKTERDRPKIELTWGCDKDTGREWIQVKDRGTGMTLDQITRYLSALGKSYYKSAEFGSEARLMRDHGLIATPISQFGIGILSCFMVAEWMDVRTCPCRRDEDKRKAWQVKITGPGALFHFTEWKAATTSGTEVRIHLKRGFALVDIPREDLIKQLRRELDYVRRNEREHNPALKVYEREWNGVRYLNPAAVAARHVIWPRHTIVARREGEAEVALVVDGGWHFELLCPWPKEEVLRQAKQDGCPPSYLIGAGWRIWDWDDKEGSEATGSRIRLVFPSCAPITEPDWAVVLGCIPERVRTVELAYWTEQSITKDNDSRQRHLVRGMRVPDIGPEIKNLALVAARVGAWIWVDFAGAAGPALTADRAKVRPFGLREQRAAWRGLLGRLFARWTAEMARCLPVGEESWAAFRFLFVIAAELRVGLMLSRIGPEFSLAESCGSSWGAAITPASLATKWLIAENFLDRDRTLSLARDRDLTVDLDRDLDLSRDFAREFDFNRTIAIARDLALARADDLASGSALARNLDRHLDLDNDRDLDFDGGFARARVHLGVCLQASLDAHVLNEGFWPSLAEAFPLFRLPAQALGLSAACLRAPAQLSWARLAADESGGRPPGNFDLCLPFSAVPWPRWHQEVPQWVEDRHWRRLLLLPFLFPYSNLANTIAWAMSEPTAQPDRGHHEDEKARLAAVQATAREIARQTLHILIPRPDWWDRPFIDWTDADWAICGYSAQWDLSTGKMLWAVGAVPRERMPQVGMPIKEFVESRQLAEFRARCPELFPAETS